ncbi:hypothetical protein [Dictyobacter aurantiacus]|uniref:Uncharacterized protein n=1 Tax=Dictyobacter aurantiacus TaxID=1936993 RepID=A0A401ZQV2_9CHLR|nr:hypothetical protein [Dictyobacter aurantiacus]GCE09249.1 hypothetical protein KDAU_65780 [Dictyobacter aurantiacus]
MRENWRDMLGNIVADDKRHKMLEAELNISAITIDRWISGESNPRMNNVRALLAAASLENDFKKCLAQAYHMESNVDEAQDQYTREISGILYDSILRDLATRADTLRTWGVIALCLNDMAVRLEAQAYRAHYIVSQCYSQQNKLLLKERYIFSHTSRTTQRILTDSYLHSETLPFIAVSVGHDILGQDGRVTNQIGVEHIKSSAAFPLLRFGSVAGCFTVCSEESSYASLFYRYFEKYSVLLSLAFADNDFLSIAELLDTDNNKE